MPADRPASAAASSPGRAGAGPPTDPLTAVRLTGGHADGREVTVPRGCLTSMWVTVIDGTAHVLDIWDDAGLRRLLTAAPRWEQYDRVPTDEGEPGRWQFVP